jgi:hypothetical protein
MKAPFTLICDWQRLVPLFLKLISAFHLLLYRDQKPNKIIISRRY